MASVSLRGTVVIAVLLLTAGCLDVGTVERTPTTDSDDEHGLSITASDRPDASKAVHVENYWNESVEVHVQVIRVRSDETVHDETYVVESGDDITAYDTAKADPDGIESFRIVVTARNETENVTIETNTCYGDTYAEIQDDGQLYLYYAIC